MKVYTFKDQLPGVVHFRSKKEMVKFARRYCRHNDLGLDDVQDRMGEFEVRSKADYIHRLNEASQIDDTTLAFVL